MSRGLESVLTELLFTHFDNCKRCDSYSTCDSGLTLIAILTKGDDVDVVVERLQDAA